MSTLAYRQETELQRLREENAALKRDIALLTTDPQDVDFEQVVQLKRAFRIDPKQARLLLLLYARRGKFVRHGEIEEALDFSSNCARKVQVSRLRNAFNDPTIVENDRDRGYRLSPKGVALVKRALAGETFKMIPGPTGPRGRERLFNAVEVATIRAEADHVSVQEQLFRYRCSRATIQRIRAGKYGV